ncbi:Glycosyltransferase family 39 protein [Mycena indigotica]|uniref:Glycosyltransferase family 39 protein n=1 Tax=Mycena indigotica TaxID=2126181 RepID=A0A8H6T1T6_9AGAR|nr:Glycosyltransferase family 39 protein [Mycena indigotica]KAF7309443.1 Glycosyltransferase family 39 protein [Mycena indigotica]
MPERPAKKARLVQPLSKPISAKRVKGSPVPNSSKNKATSKGKEKAKPEQPQLPTKFKLVAGSYEKLLYGLEGSVSYDDSGLSFHLKPIFAFPAHVSAIKAVAASPHGGKWLATGSADEIIKVWDLRRKKEIGGLMHHEGSITHLNFPSRSHLLSASEDGTLCLFRARDWAVLRALRGHKGRVNSVAVHPSGKVALSVGKDRTLRMWDLMRGKGSASTKLGKEAELVRWSTNGTLFVVQTGSTIDVYNTEMTLLHTIQHPSRLQDVLFTTRVDGGELLLAGAEDKRLSIYDMASTKPEDPPRIIAAMVGHENRVKAVQTLAIALPSNAPRSSTTIVSTVSSDGKIHVYDLASVPAQSAPGQEVPEILPVVVYDTNKTRLTCLALADGTAAIGEDDAVVNGKRKQSTLDEESDDEEEDWEGLHEEEEQEQEAELESE